MTRRRVTAVVMKPGGVELRLECGHWLWCGGFVQVRTGDLKECREGPCYQAQRFMGG